MDLIREGYKIRVKTGCSTCRIRKVKCDEKKPSCIRCTSTGRTCDGYGNSSPHSRPPSKFVHGYPVAKASDAPKVPPIAASMAEGLSTLKPTLSPFTTNSESQAFGFFRNVTLSMFCIYHGAEHDMRCNFWSDNVLKLSVSVPAVRYALCSLSELHRAFLISHGSSNIADAAERRRHSLHQYGLAIKHTQEILAESLAGAKDKIFVGLIVCVLFVCYENFIGNYANAQTHLQNGLRIMSRHIQYIGSLQKNSQRVELPRDVIRTFQRLDLQAMTFADAQAPYPYQLCPEPLVKIEAALQSSEDSFDDLYAALIDALRWAFRVAAESEPNPIPKDKIQKGSEFLHSWDRLFRHRFSDFSSRSIIELPANALLLRLYYLLFYIMIKTSIYGDELRHDNHKESYREIVDIGHEILRRKNGGIPSPKKNNYYFTFEMGIIPPLFVTALHCRYSDIRWRAISLMSSAHIQEGSWESMACARVAEFVVGIEEPHMDPNIGGTSIPAENRVHLVNVQVNAERRQVEVGAILRDLEGNWYVKEGLVSY
ncbi:hypothetical protein B0O99DRAFT_744764 [Bisporella sp. PMI_857]|nr:hypothetical protein B0O99DRAFT_744764 [Bisporella sp. PMI_857]